MEHRWGLRRTLDVGVKLYGQANVPTSGRMLNASASGAYIAMGARLAAMSRVHVAFEGSPPGGGGRPRIAAYVVRSDARGIGIEWQEFAPDPVLALIERVQAFPARALPCAVPMISASGGTGTRLALTRSNRMSGDVRCGA
jgi:hypothetical protein